MDFLGKIGNLLVDIGLLFKYILDGLHISGLLLFGEVIGYGLWKCLYYI